MNLTSEPYHWLLPDPFVIPWEITKGHIDHYNHANNVAYVSQLEQTSWAHSNALGLSIEQYQSLDRGMAISRHEIDYLAPALLGDTLLCATWIITCDSRLKLTRQFQFIRQSDGLSMLKARTEFVCIALSSGRPKRMPAIFTSTYGPAISSKVP
ncbi:MAG: acyl-CoA thioester hydrolase [Paraglaciecola sp.]|jgi:acyl-CoA thioester hydrolase